MHSWLFVCNRGTPSLAVASDHGETVVHANALIVALGVRHGVRADMAYMKLSKPSTRMTFVRSAQVLTAVLGVDQRNDVWRRDRPGKACRFARLDLREHSLPFRARLPGTTERSLTLRLGAFKYLSLP